MNIESEINKELKLDDKSQKDILESEFNTDIENLSSELSGYQINSEKKKAWVVSIKKKNDSIHVEFLLPSTDKFTKMYSYPDKRLPENNKFRQLIEDMGYTINNLELVIGEPVDIYYNERTNNWDPKVHQKQVKDIDEPLLCSTKSQQAGHSNVNLFNFKVVVLIFLVIPIIFRLTRFYGLLALMVMLLGYYLIKS